MIFVALPDHLRKLLFCASPPYWSPITHSLLLSPPSTSLVVVPAPIAPSAQQCHPHRTTHKSSLSPRILLSPTRLVST